MRTERPSPPHPATVVQPKEPHPAAAARPKTPHPATVAQARRAPPGPPARPPHLATVAQARRAPPGPPARPPHLATVAQARRAPPGPVLAPPHRATVTRPRRGDVLQRTTNDDGEEGWDPQPWLKYKKEEEPEKKGKRQQRLPRPEVQLPLGTDGVEFLAAAETAKFRRLRLGTVAGGDGDAENVTCHLSRNPDGENVTWTEVARGGDTHGFAMGDQSNELFQSRKDGEVKVLSRALDTLLGWKAPTLYMVLLGAWGPCDGCKRRIGEFVLKWKGRAPPEQSLTITYAYGAILGTTRGQGDQQSDTTYGYVGETEVDFQGKSLYAHTWGPELGEAVAEEED